MSRRGLAFWSFSTPLRHSFPIESWTSYFQTLGRRLLGFLMLASCHFFLDMALKKVGALGCWATGSARHRCQLQRCTTCGTGGCQHYARTRIPLRSVHWNTSSGKSIPREMERKAGNHYQCYRALSHVRSFFSFSGLHRLRFALVQTGQCCILLVKVGLCWCNSCLGSTVAGRQDFSQRSGSEPH